MEQLPRDFRPPRPTPSQTSNETGRTSTRDRTVPEQWQHEHASTVVSVGALESLETSQGCVRRARHTSTRRTTAPSVVRARERTEVSASSTLASSAAASAPWPPTESDRRAEDARVVESTSKARALRPPLPNAPPSSPISRCQMRSRASRGISRYSRALRPLKSAASTRGVERAERAGGEGTSATAAEAAESSRAEAEAEAEASAAVPARGCGVGATSARDGSADGSGSVAECGSVADWRWCLRF